MQALFQQISTQISLSPQIPLVGFFLGQTKTADIDATFVVYVYFDCQFWRHTSILNFRYPLSALVKEIFFIFWFVCRLYLSRFSRKFLSFLQSHFFFSSLLFSFFSFLVGESFLSTCKCHIISRAEFHQFMAADVGNWNLIFCELDYIYIYICISVFLNLLFLLM